MPLLTRTCFIFPLKCGAISTFVFSTVVSLVPLITLPSVISKLSANSLFLNVSQICFAVFAGIVAIIGSIYKHPYHLLIFLTYYLGIVLLDFVSIIGTIVLRTPFFAHDLLRGSGVAVSKKPSSKTVWMVSVFFFTIHFLLRVYFTTIVYCYYEEMKASLSDSDEEVSEESPPKTRSSTPKSSGSKTTSI